MGRADVLEKPKMTTSALELVSRRVFVYMCICTRVYPDAGFV